MNKLFFDIWLFWVFWACKWPFLALTADSAWKRMLGHTLKSVIGPMEAYMRGCFIFWKVEDHTKNHISSQEICAARSGLFVGNLKCHNSIWWQACFWNLIVLDVFRLEVDLWVKRIQRKMILAHTFEIIFGPMEIHVVGYLIFLGGWGPRAGNAILNWNSRFS